MRAFTFMAVSLFILCTFANMRSKDLKEMKLSNEDNTQARINNFSYYFNKR